MSIREKAASVASVVTDAGGLVVGRTRLQKIAYLLSAAGLDDGFSFVYKHYGPYSDELFQYTRIAELLGLLHAEEQRAQWGGTYSTYSTPGQPTHGVPVARLALAQLAANADAVELELAATAVFLQKEGFADPWAETARRKPEKTEGGRLKRAKALYNQLRAISTPTPLPPL
jgi:hypothetical protein